MKDLDLFGWSIVVFACFGVWLLVQVLLREFCPQKVQIVGNGHQLNELALAVVGMMAEDRAART